MQSKSLQLDKFKSHESVFKCPVCGSPLSIQDQSLVCRKRHCFDVSSNGHVNLLPNAKSLKGYGARFFEARRAIMEAGVYDVVIEALIRILANQASGSAVLDAGCGEGHAAHVISKQIAASVFAFDYSKDAVKIAAKQKDDVRWFVGDVAKIPLCDATMDAVLSIFSPANYREFARVLKPGGMIIKVFPEPHHFEEARALGIGEAVPVNETMGSLSFEHFSEVLSVISQERIKATVALDQNLVDDLVDMTPILFDVPKSEISSGSLSQITIDVLVAVGVLNSKR